MTEERTLPSIFANIETTADAGMAMREIVLAVLSPEPHDPVELMKWPALSVQGKMVAVSMFCTLVVAAYTKTRPVFRSNDTHFQLTPAAARLLRHLVDTRDTFVMAKMGEWCIAMLKKGPQNG